MIIIGTLGKIRINLIANVYAVEYYKIDKNTSSGIKTLKKSSISIKTPKNSSIFMGIENLINCINRKKKPMSTGYDGLKSVELILAATQSYEQNKTIRLPFSNNKYKIHSK